MTAKADQRAFQRAMAFTPCPTCTYDFTTGEGETSCHYYACPYLPDELNVVCPVCNYNFLTRETVPGCGETPQCEFALQEAPGRMATVRAWRERHGLPA